MHRGRGFLMKKYIQLFLLFVVLLVTTQTASAAQWTKEEVEPTYVWTVTFNAAVNVESFQKYATLTTKHTNSLPVVANAVNEKVIAIKAPQQGYSAGETYTLTIPTTVQALDGTPLAEEATLTFTIQAAEAEKPIEGDKPDENTSGLTADEAALVTFINDYRASLNLKPYTVSKSLTEVARAHVQDSNMYTPEKGVDKRGQTCNLHSWSNNGKWTPVCYTSDHYYAVNMWSKPYELTAYKGNGYEISAMSTKMSPQAAFELWRKSAGHEALMSSNGTWRILTTMGVAIDGNYAHVWFGSDRDPVGYYE